MKPKENTEAYSSAVASNAGLGGFFNGETKMKNTEIADLLRELNRAKGKVKEIKTQLMVVAVEELGISQKEAQQSNVESILDGYLIGQGMMQTWRDAA